MIFNITKIGIEITYSHLWEYRYLFNGKLMSDIKPLCLEKG